MGPLSSQAPIIKELAVGKIEREKERERERERERESKERKKERKKRVMDGKCVEVHWYQK